MFSNVVYVMESSSPLSHTFVGCARMRNLAVRKNITYSTNRLRKSFIIFLWIVFTKKSNVDEKERCELRGGKNVETTKRSQYTDKFHEFISEPNVCARLRPRTNSRSQAIHSLLDRVCVHSCACVHCACSIDMAFTQVAFACLFSPKSIYQFSSNSSVVLHHYNHNHRKLFASDFGLSFYVIIICDD